MRLLRTSIRYHVSCWEPQGTFESHFLYPADPRCLSVAAGLTAGGSRPHSSPSAELEQSLAGMSLSSHQALPPPTSAPSVPTSTGTTSRSKESSRLVFCFIFKSSFSLYSMHILIFYIYRYKNKRTYPSLPNQPSESGAHFMFELAKTVLVKAGGNSSTSLFTQTSTSQGTHHGPHRALHMCAFQIGLYALGLHNCVSPNWLSRTYSSHVSWITGMITILNVGYFGETKHQANRTNFHLFFRASYGDWSSSHILLD